LADAYLKICYNTKLATIGEIFNNYHQGCTKIGQTQKIATYEVRQITRLMFCIGTDNIAELVYVGSCEYMI
jgi:capsule polysaccharide modification protein KpsS